MGDKTERVRGGITLEMTAMNRLRRRRCMFQWMLKQACKHLDEQG
jgi:hypothetical protein